MDDGGRFRRPRIFRSPGSYNFCGGDAPDLPLGSQDSTILRWAEREQRILVTFDKSSINRHLSEHLAAGNHCPGIFMVPTESKPVQVLDFLILAAHASEPAEWVDWINYLD